MGIYRTPYLKFEFSSQRIDINLYQYLKNSSEKELLNSFNDFRIKEILDFKSDFKFERICLIVGRIFALIGITSVIVILNYEDVPANIFAPGALLIFPSLFLLSLSYSYALSLRELKLAIKRRKQNLLKAQKIAKNSKDFNEFLSKITI